MLIILLSIAIRSVAEDTIISNHRSATRREAIYNVTVIIVIFSPVAKLVNE